MAELGWFYLSLCATLAAQSQMPNFEVHIFARKSIFHLISTCRNLFSHHRIRFESGQSFLTIARQYGIIQRTLTSVME